MNNVPTTMHAVLMTGHGGFEKLAYRDDVPVPAPGAGEVLIRIGAAGINNTDINTRIGWYAGAVGEATDGAGEAGWNGAGFAFPRIQGADACGRIVAVGPGVAAERIGERVLVEPVFRLHDAAGGERVVYFGSEWDGAFAQFARVPAAHAVRVDSPLTDAELASFPCAWSAAENMLVRAAVAPGETVLVTGASGGVGLAAVQLAHYRGARVIAVAGRAKAEAVRAVGAERAVARGADLVEELGAESVDVAIDVVGGVQFPQLLSVLRRGGRYAVAGAIGGAEVTLDLRTLYLKDLRMLGCTVLGAGVFANVVACIESGRVRPMVAAEYPLAQIVAAQEAFLGKSLVGKVVLLPPA